MTLCRNPECRNDVDVVAVLWGPPEDGLCGRCAELVPAFAPTQEPDEWFHCGVESLDDLEEGMELPGADQCSACGSWVMREGADPVEAEYRARQIGGRWYARCDCGALYPIHHKRAYRVVFA